MSGDYPSGTITGSYPNRDERTVWMIRWGLQWAGAGCPATIVDDRHFRIGQPVLWVDGALAAAVNGVVK